MKIKEYITAHRLKSVEFAAMVEISTPALSLYMSGDRTPSPSVARRIIAATGGEVTFEDLYGVVAPVRKPVVETREAAA